MNLLKKIGIVALGTVMIATISLFSSTTSNSHLEHVRGKFCPVTINTPNVQVCNVDLGSIPKYRDLKNLERSQKDLINRLEFEKTGLQSQKQQLTGERDTARKQTSSLQNQLNDKADEITDLQKQRDDARTQRDRVKHAYDRINRELIAYQSESKSLNSSLKQLRATIKNLRTQLNTKTKEPETKKQIQPKREDQKKSEEGGGIKMPPAKNRSKLALPIGLGVGLGVPTLATGIGLVYSLIRKYWN